MQKSNDPLLDKSYLFSLRVIRLSDLLTKNREWAIANQVLRSGTSIGASIREAKQAHTKAEFTYKLSNANKEAFETEYWLMLLRDSGKLKREWAHSILCDCNELQAMLVSSIKTSKRSR